MLGGSRSFSCESICIKLLTFDFLITYSQNLLQAAEAAKTDAHNISCNALVAASLRADLSATSSKLDIALSQNEEYKRKNALLEEENYRVTSKLRQVIQEKIKLERDQRMSMSLTKYLENSASTDADFYKRQTAELTSRLQVSVTLCDMGLLEQRKRRGYLTL
jgi:hypothetical protein